MSRTSLSASWTVPNGDFGALRLTSEVFMAHRGVRVQVRNGGTLIGRQGSSLAACLCLLLFAPARLLPKRVRIDVTEGQGQVQVHALLDDSFFLPKLSGIVAGRYRHQFEQWIDHLHGQVLPPDIPEDDLDEGSSGLRELEAAGFAGTTINLAGSTPEAVGASFHGDITIKEMPGARMAEIGITGPPTPAQAGDAQPASLNEPAAQVNHDNGLSQVGQTAGQVATGGKVASPRRGRFRFPGFGLRKPNREPSVAEEGLPEEARRHMVLADQALEAKALSQALTHYDAALKAIADRSIDGVFDAIAVGRLFFKRGLTRFSQAQSSLSLSGSTERTVSDYQIATEMTRQAVADYSEAIRLHPSSLGYYRRGEAHLFTARCERGSRSFRRASEELNAAVQDLTHATERNPTFASAFAVRAIAYSLLERDDESEADVSKAVALGTDAETLRRAIRASREWRS